MRCSQSSSLATKRPRRPVSWALAEIAERPDVIDRIVTELKQTSGGTPPDAEHLTKLEYLDGALRESLRLRPVAPFVVRKTVKPFMAGGREYPPGVVLCPCSYLVHRREDLYPDPSRFRPERFLAVDWVCRYEIGWPEGMVERQAAGIDAVQAVDPCAADDRRRGLYEHTT